jgi:all-trans-retinol 13,14-reductase
VFLILKIREFRLIPENNKILSFNLLLFIRSMNTHFDLIVIGSGLGGLLSAVVMAKEGYKVAVIEQNKQIGGCLQTFSFGKKVFDSCVHYIGALDAGQTQNRIFKYAGIMDDLKLRRLDTNGFDQVVFGDQETSFPQAQGLSNFREQLLSYFPKEQHALSEYTGLLEKVGASFPLYTLRSGQESEKEWVRDWEVTETLARLSNNPLLQNVLAGNNLLYAGQRNKTPFYIHALVVKSYIDSAYACEGGSSQISKQLLKKLREHGGTIFTKERVSRLELQAGHIQKAITESGRVFIGKQFIANVHPQKMLEWIKDPALKPGYRNRIARAENTISAFMVNIVLKPGRIRCPNHNIYWNKTGDAFAAMDYRPADWPANYALYFGQDAQHPGFADTLAILTYMRKSDWEQWEDTRNHAANFSERCPQYHDLKHEKADMLLRTVMQRFPELRGGIADMKIASPLTFRDYMGTSDGSMYGMAKDVRYPEMTQIPVITKIPNLLLTGQNTGLHGVLGVSIGALATCSALLGRDYLLTKINQV